MDQPPDDATGGAPIAGTTAPAGMSFATTRTIDVPVAALVPPARTEAVHVRIAMAPDTRRALYVGRVWPSRGGTLRLSVPLEITALRVEVYDERGPISDRTWEVP